MDVMATTADTTALTRDEAVRRARWLNRATIAWNGTEGVIAVWAGLAAGSVSLVGFGVDSAIEVSAAVILAWRLTKERDPDCTQDADRRATRAIAVSFAVLAVYVATDAITDLRGGARPDASVPGLVLAALSLALMPLLARAKRRLAPVLGSAAALADAKQTDICALLSAIVLAGVGANAAFEWWWADPLAGLGIAAVAAVEARRTWRAESLADTCCA
jgi:divalent metal cation (Fe/Co/Zn/Cd) transporter